MTATDITIAGETQGTALVLRLALVVLVADVAVLVVTGSLLTALYTPGAGALVVVVVHRWSSHLALPLSILTVLLTLLTGARRVRTSVSRIVRAALLPIALLLASSTGFLLPWDELGSGVGAPATSSRGYGWLFGDGVRVVIAGGAEIAPDVMRRWFVLHLMAGVVAAALLPLRAMLGSRRRQSSRL